MTDLVTDWPPVQTEHDRSCDGCNDPSCRCFCEECIELHPERVQLSCDRVGQEGNPS
jgi:hypothetical protein